MLKTCSCCNSPKQFDEFGTDRKRAGGKNVYCLECARHKALASRNKAIERITGEGYVIPESKVCSSCREQKPHADFHRNKARKDGLSVICASCAKQKATDFYRNNLERGRDVRRRWRMSNREKKIQYDRHYYRSLMDTDPEKIRAAGRRATHKRRCRMNGSYTAEEYLELLERCSASCLKCGGTDKLTTDHVVAIYAGGSNYIRNLQILCSSCNRAKGVSCVDYRLWTMDSNEIALCA